MPWRVRHVSLSLRAQQREYPAQPFPRQQDEAKADGGRDSKWVCERQREPIWAFPSATSFASQHALSMYAASIAAHGIGNGWEQRRRKEKARHQSKFVDRFVSDAACLHTELKADSRVSGTQLSSRTSNTAWLSAQLSCQAA